MNTEGSEYDRLFYPFLFEHSPEERLEDLLTQVRYSTMAKCREIIALRQRTLEQCGERIIAAARVMAEAFTRGATLLAFGNGGSATDAQDMVCELMHPPCLNAGPLPALALTSDSAVITAVGNDVGFENIFARQIIAFGRPGDIALGISTSGNSPDMLRAFEQARAQGLMTVGITGYGGGKVARSAALDFCLIAPGEHIPRIQEAQATIYHALLEILFTLVRKERKRDLREGNDEICR